MRYWNNGVHYGTRFWFWYGLHYAFSRIKEQSEQASQRHGGTSYFWEIICLLLLLVIQAEAKAKYMGAAAAFVLYHEAGWLVRWLDGWMHA